MSDRYDVVVIGTGFGGAVSACRLAQAGARVLILERGRRWTQATYPRKPGDPWLYSDKHPERHHGWLDLRVHRGMTIAQGAGVGGGSLCYSSVVMEADADRFDQHWPEEISLDSLRPYYQRVHEMLALQPIPKRQRTPRYELLRHAAEALNWGDRVESVPLAIAFDPDYHYGLPDPLNPKHSKTFTNPQGVKQGTCIHLGNCDVGCDVHAKNTLDLNYIPAAETAGAELRTLHLVRYLELDGTGYKVVWERIEDGRLIPGSIQADRVIVAAGSLGTTEILLRSRDQHRSLPKLSQALGCHWSANANFLSPSRYPDGVEVKQGTGPTISAGLNFMDGEQHGQRFYIEDDGFPNLLLNTLNASFAAGEGGVFKRLLRRHLRRGLSEKNPHRQVMVWLGEGIDAADGRLRLKRGRLKPWQLQLEWDVKASKPVIDAILATQQRLSEVQGGRLRVPAYWRWLRSLVTVHPLGGCAMAADPSQGVTDHRGQVFGYPGLYIADGALLPRPTGRNPSMTIAALAERVAERMIKQ